MNDREIGEQIRERLQRLGRPTTEKDLLKQLRLKGKARQAAKHVLRKMLEKGELVSTRTDRIGLAEKMNVIAGRLEMKRGGFGFVVPDKTKERGLQDIYVAGPNLADALHGDRVLVHIEGRGRGGREGQPDSSAVARGAKADGRIVQVIERRTKSIVGRLEIDAAGTRVVPLDARLLHEVFIPDKDLHGAASGDMVVAEITRFPSPYRAPMGRIVEVLGAVGDPGVDVAVVIAKHGIPDAFPDDVLSVANAIATEVSVDSLEGREDFRGREIVTIDGETARDFDDAVEVEVLESGNYRLGVHIADVSHYVTEGSPLDDEAFVRGTSVYFPDRAVPMLPERLSNGICSLNPGVDRLVQSVFVDVTPAGEVVGRRFADGVIRSAARMTYTKVRQVLVDDDEAVRREYESLIPSFERMLALYEILRARRIARGSIDFDRPDAEVVLDESGEVVDIRPEERNVAHRIIEEFMLLANEAVAAHFSENDAPSIFRIHEEPDEDRVEQFEDFILGFGYRLRAPSEALRPKVFRKLLERIEGKPEERIISYVMLRAMKQAVYSAENSGHYALAAGFYTHFTSPIRRYPDLVVHRLLRKLRREKKAAGDSLERIAEHCSVTERRAADAERELVGWKKVRFMADKVGDVFDAIISGVTGFGLYVELIDYFVEGLVHISTLVDDYYLYNEANHTLRGDSTGRIFQLGGEITVQLTRVNLADRQLDFALEGLVPRERTPSRLRPPRRTRHR
jgi:ribonuclease R